MTHIFLLAISGAAISHIIAVLNTLLLMVSYIYDTLSIILRTNNNSKLSLFVNKRPDSDNNDVVYIKRTKVADIASDFSLSSRNMFNQSMGPNIVEVVVVVHAFISSTVVLMLMSVLFLLCFYILF